MLKYSFLSGKQKSYDNIQLLDIILHSSEVMANLVNDLLEVIDCEQQQTGMTFRMISLPLLLDKVHAAFRSEARRLGVLLDFEVAPGVPQLMQGDSNRLIQILTHLLCNSFNATGRRNKDFGEHKGRITVTVSMEANSHDMVLFQVTDNGCGIGEEEQTLLFVPFYHENSMHFNTNDAPGYGVGLYLCKSLVTTMGYVNYSIICCVSISWECV